MSPPASTSDSDLETVVTYRDAQQEMKPQQNFPIGGNPKYICSINGGCGATFKRLDHLDRHEYHHTGIRKHACIYEHCNKSYSILTHLKRHLRVTHERIGGSAPNKSINCTMENCDKMFTSACNMQRHIREVHENPKIYRCIYCDEKFRQKLKMRRHEIQCHTHEFPYNCNKCSRGFYQQWQYERHSVNCKAYPCHDCEEVFEKWSQYTKHCKETQHGRKNYKDKSNKVKKHKSAEQQLSGNDDDDHDHDHDDDDDDDDDDSASDSSDRIVKQKAKNVAYMCTFKGCKRIYAYLRNLKQHILTAHAGKRFKCKEQNCTSCFSSEQNLKKHLERIHGLTKKQRKRSNKTENVITNKKIKITKTTTSEATTTSARKQRKDAGKTLVSSITQFSAFAIDKDFDELLRNRDANALKTINDKMMLMETCNNDEVLATLMPKVIEINHITSNNNNNKNDNDNEHNNDNDVNKTEDTIETFLTFALEDNTT